MSLLLGSNLLAGRPGSPALSSASPQPAFSFCAVVSKPTLQPTGLLSLPPASCRGGCCWFTAQLPAWGHAAVAKWGAQNKDSTR